MARKSCVGKKLGFFLVNSATGWRERGTGKMKLNTLDE